MAVDAERPELKVQFQTSEGMWEQRNNDPVWVAFDFVTYSDRERLIGKKGRVVRREPPAKPIAKSRKKDIVDKKDFAKTDSITQPSFNLFQIETWFPSKSENPNQNEELRDKYFRD